MLKDVYILLRLDSGLCNEEILMCPIESGLFAKKEETCVFSDSLTCSILDADIIV